MFQSIKRLSKETIIYGAGNVMSRMIPFLLLPALTNILLPEEFAVQAIYYIMIAIAMEIVRLGLDISLLRFYIPEKDPQKRQLVFSSIFWTAIIFTTVISLSLWFGAQFWTELILSTPTSDTSSLSGLTPGSYPVWMYDTLRLCALIIFVDNILAFPLVILRCENRPRMFFFARITGVTVHTVMVLILLFNLGHGIEGIFEGNLIGSTVTLLITLPILWKRLRFKFSFSVITSCLLFGLPNVPNVLFVQVVELSDRIILQHLRNYTEVGIYSAGYKLGTFLAIVAMGFRLAWQPFFMQMKDKPDAKEVFARVLTYLMAIVAWMYLVLTAFVEPIATWEIPQLGRSLIAEPYWSGIDVFPVVLLAHVFNTVYAVFMVGIYFKKKMWVLPYITGVAAVVNLGGNLLLVPYFGMWASAWLTVAAYAIMAVLLYVYVQSVYHVVYEWRRIIHLCIVGAIVFIIAEISKGYNLYWIGYTVSIIFPILLFLSGIATPGERARLRSMVGI